MRRLSCLLAVLVLVGCGSSPDTSESTATNDDAITADELAAGASWDGVETESDDEVNAYPDDETHGVYPAERLAIDPEVTLPDEEDTEACRRATGYRSGHPFGICITYVDGKPVEVHTAHAFRVMAAAAARAGVHIHIVSGFRTMAEQRYLYWLYKHHRGNLAAPPGFSNHQSGHALDLNTSSRGVYAWLARHGAAYGFRRTVSSEPWHWEHW
jgi:hypothetical protein